MGPEYLAPKAWNCSKNDRDISKEKRSQFKEAPAVQIWNNVNIKTNNDSDRLQFTE